jgi:hypothetical protein
VDAILLNEFLKEHLTVQEQGAIIKQQQQEIKALKAELKEQASRILKVSTQLQLSKPERQAALNNHQSCRSTEAMSRHVSPHGGSLFYATLTVR